MLRWGLVPFWAKDPAIGNRMINARAETVAEKPSYRAAYRHRRCLVLADGFYEWTTRRRGKAAVLHFAGQSGEPFAFAGLWETLDRSRQTGETLQTATLITTAANEYMQLGASPDARGAAVPKRRTGWLAGSPMSSLHGCRRANSPQLQGLAGRPPG